MTVSPSRNKSVCRFDCEFVSAFLLLLSTLLHGAERYFWARDRNHSLLTALYWTANPSRWENNPQYTCTWKSREFRVIHALYHRTQHGQKVWELFQALPQICTLSLDPCPNTCLREKSPASCHWAKETHWTHRCPTVSRFHVMKKAGNLIL